MSITAPKVLVSGYYGFGNVGDEAVLGGMVSSLRQLISGIGISVLTSNPALTCRLHPEVTAVKRYDWARVVSALRGSDLFISGGGSLLQDTTSVRSLYYYLGMLRLARLLRCPVAIYSQGIGPIERPGLLRAAANEIGQAKLITVRDADSRELLSQAGVSADRINICADPAFLVDSDYEAANNMISKLGLQDKQLLAVCLRPWKSSADVIGEILSSAEEFASSCGAHVLVLPMQDSEDMQAMQGTKSGHVAMCGGDFRLAKGLISRCRAVIGMRLHSLIFAASEAVPFLPIAYDPKVSAFARSITKSEGISVGSVEKDLLLQRLREVWSEDYRQRLDLDKVSAAMKDSALQPALVVKSFLGQ